MCSEYWSNVIKTLLKRRKYLGDRFCFLDSLPKKQYGVVYPNTFSYKHTFEEMRIIDDVLFDVNILQKWYIDVVCPVCGKIIGFNHFEIHHTSYYPEVTTPVHKKCHLKIHYSDTYTYLRPPIGDGKDFRNHVKKLPNWITSAISETESKVTYSCPASCYPRPNLTFNRAAETEISVKYIILWRRTL